MKLYLIAIVCMIPTFVHANDVKEPASLEIKAPSPLEDQITRLRASGTAVWQMKMRADQELLNCTEQNASVEARLNQALANIQAKDKKIDELEKASKAIPPSIPESDKK